MMAASSIVCARMEVLAEQIIIELEHVIILVLGMPGLIKLLHLIRVVQR